MLGYGVGERTELIGRGTWYESHWTGIEAGRLDGDPLYAFFEPNNYEEVGLEIGVRYYLSAQSRLKSYVAPIVGARFLNDILVTYAAQEAGTSIPFVPFTKKGAVPVFGVDIGFTFDLGNRLYVGMDTGMRYQSATSKFDYLPGWRPRRQRRALDRPGDGHAGDAFLGWTGCLGGSGVAKQGVWGAVWEPPRFADPLAPSLRNPAWRGRGA